MNFKIALAMALLSTAAIGQAEASTATFITSSPYAKFADSPFAAVPGIMLEDFEDGALNSPGVTASAGVVAGPGNSVDSVDGDDGVLDGNGNAGHSWYLTVPTVAFSFDAAVLGSLPTKVGIVWTDVGRNGNGAAQGGLGDHAFFDDVVMRAFDKDGKLLGGVLFDNLGDGNVGGATAEDRFFGAIFDGGISRITLTSLNGSPDWEVDHLQYGGFAVPLPSSGWLLAPALALIGLRRKRA